MATATGDKYAPRQHADVAREGFVDRQAIPVEVAVVAVAAGRPRGTSVCHLSQ
jgi:hypothetical protein